MNAKQLIEKIQDAAKAANKELHELAIYASVLDHEGDCVFGRLYHADGADECVYIDDEGDLIIQCD